MFEEYLISKKIDPARFKAAEPERYAEFERDFAQMHPNSFTMQKLFLINQLRRAYLIPAAPGKPQSNKN